MLKLKNNANQERGIDMDLQLRDTHLRVLWVAGINYSKNSGVNPHVHDDFYQLLFVMEGEGTITINQHSFPSLAGHCYLIPQGVEHSFRFTQETTTLDFKFILEKELADVILAGNQTGPFFVTNKSEFMHLFQLSCSHLQAHPSTLLPYQIDAGFKYSLLSMMQDKSTLKISAGWQSPGSLESSPDHPGIQQLMDYLKKNLQSKVNLEDIANHMGFHPHYLIELFRRHLGTTPIQYLQMLRLEKSKEYLQFTNHSISEIAEMIGLSAPYFSRLFCDRIGISPSQYREKTRTVIGRDIILEQDFTIETQPTVIRG
jgi:AraC family transcriptional regulator of arabinose operon